MPETARRARSGSRFVFERRDAPPAAGLGTYPTPIEHAPSLSTAKTDVWIKRDDLTAEIYGGNKVRKLEYMFGQARARGKTKLVTAGSVGSHHVLATAAFGRRAGFRVTAALVPQPRSEYVLTVLRAMLAQGVHAIPVRSYLTVPLHLAAHRGHDAYFVALGGSSVLGTLAYVDAARELAADVRRGAVPEPDVAYVTFGTGGTAAGLALGFALERLKTHVVGVSIVEPPQVFTRVGRRLVRATAKFLGASREEAADANERLEIDSRWLGEGYGKPTEAGERAIARAAEAGIVVDSTYTAKTFAAADARVRAGDVKTLVFWQTYSTAPLAPLLVGAPSPREVDPALLELLV
jgi:1-aminocyclopropane-1-carboxylate deaminase/D-cysteine desulfhydrase-like pyridoxal-dependent ACC family enzyme